MVKSSSNVYQQTPLGNQGNKPVAVSMLLESPNNWFNDEFITMATFIKPINYFECQWTSDNLQGSGLYLKAFQIDFVFKRERRDVVEIEY